MRGKQKRNAMTSQGVNVCTVTATGHIKQYLSMQANCESSRRKKQHVRQRSMKTSMLQKVQRTRTRVTDLAQFCSENRFTSTVCHIYTNE